MTYTITAAGNGASNTRLQLTMAVGTATPLAGSFYKVRRLPAGVVANTIQQVTGTFVN